VGAILSLKAVEGKKEERRKMGKRGAKMREWVNSGMGGEKKPSHTQKKKSWNR